jgi:ubiquinol-cytochrome c reductase iron-sulfur subunit
VAVTETAEPTRRDFLYIATGAAGAVGAAALVWPFISQLQPDASVLALSSTEVDLSQIQEGQIVTVKWRGKPVFVWNRTEKDITEAKGVAVASLIDPVARNANLPADAPATDENRAAKDKEKWLVVIGICTHLGCVPTYYPNPSATDPAPNWPGGYLCPCHGSKYDLAGRVYAGVPAPYNLPVPPYHMVSKTIARIGENPPGSTFDLNSVVQI